MQAKGIVAAGHPLTAQAAEIILQAGGNAFDAIIAAHYAACVAEPVLASLGGGGFLMAWPGREAPRVYDFFVQTPKKKRPLDEIDFHPILADFGTAQQEFHIGYGAVATPGAVRGLFAVQRELGTMPMRELVAPALAFAREGIKVNDFQAYIFKIVEAIFCATPEAKALYASQSSTQGLLQQGEIQYCTEMADFMEILAIEGEDLFYRGEVAQAIIEQSRQGGGYLRSNDLEAYQVIRQSPLTMHYKGAQLAMNPPPSCGGILMAFALKLLEAPCAMPFGSAAYVQRLVRIMALTNQARMDAYVAAKEGKPDPDAFLDEGLLQKYRALVVGQPLAKRGTTHLSVMDNKGNVASMTVSNGEGCGSIVPGTGMMLNNMLGEEDLNPGGFHQWPADQRMASMMAPCVGLLANGSRIALGSGGSNRIRTAILQVLLHLVDGASSVEEAVQHPRLHFENDLLSIEAGWSEDILRPLRAAYPNHRLWEERNLFFGGAHTVMQTSKGFTGAGDPRRGGVCRRL